MANRPLKDKNIRNIQRSNGTYYVTLPKDLVQELKWKEKQKVVVTKRGKKLSVCDWNE